MQGVQRDNIMTTKIITPRLCEKYRNEIVPQMMEKFGYQEGDFPVTEKLGKNGLALPFSSVMSEAQVELVCKIIRECILRI